MKQILSTLVLLLISVTAIAQCNYSIHGRTKNKVEFGYIDASFDVNNALNVFKSPTEPQGLDYDLELGLRQDRWNPYIFYGRYDATNYSNLGGGIDYILLRNNPRYLWGHEYEVGVGINLGKIYRNMASGDESYFSYAFRIKPMYTIYDNVSVFTKLQYQQRQDRSFHGLIELYAGLLFKL